MEKKQINVVDCGCGANVKKEVDELVKEGTKPTKAEHDERQKEIDEAFSKDKQNK